MVDTVVRHIRRISYEPQEHSRSDGMIGMCCFWVLEDLVFQICMCWVVNYHGVFWVSGDFRFERGHFFTYLVVTRGD